MTISKMYGTAVKKYKKQIGRLKYFYIEIYYIVI